MSPARDKDSKSRERALSQGYDVIDKSHLSEWKGEGRGSTTKSDFWEWKENGVLSLKTKETQLATLSSKLDYLNTGKAVWGGAHSPRLCSNNHERVSISDFLPHQSATNDGYDHQHSQLWDIQRWWGPVHHYLHCLTSPGTPGGRGQCQCISGASMRKKKLCTFGHLPGRDGIICMFLVTWCVIEHKKVLNKAFHFGLKDVNCTIYLHNEILHIEVSILILP